MVILWHHCESSLLEPSIFKSERGKTDTLYRERENNSVTLQMIAVSVNSTIGTCCLDSRSHRIVQILIAHSLKGTAGESNCFLNQIFSGWLSMNEAIKSYTSVK